MVSSHRNSSIEYNRQDDNVDILVESFNATLACRIGDGEAYRNICINYIFSVRTVNALASININTLEDLIEYLAINGDKDLIKIRNFGKKSLKEMYDVLAYYGILKDKIRSILDSINKSRLKNSKPDNMSNHINTDEATKIPTDTDEIVYIPSIPLADLCDVFFANDLSLQNIHTTVDLLTFCNNHSFADLYRAKAFSKDVTRNIMNLLAIVQDRNRWSELQNMIVGVWNKKLTLVPIPRPIKGLFIYIEESHLEKTIELIQQHYLTSVERLSVRAQNVIKSEIPYFGDAIIISLLYSERYKYFRNCGRQTWEEIKLFAKKFCIGIRTITSAPFDELLLLIELNKISYPQGKEDLFIAKFYRDNEYLPMFYILASYLVNSDNRAVKLYRAAHGILCPPIHMSDIAKQYGITRERVRQIIASVKVEYKYFTLLTNWQTYRIEDYLYLSSRSPLYHDVQVCENLEELSVEGFGYLCKLLYPFTHIIVKDNHYFFAQRLLDCFDIKSALTDIENTLSKKVAKDTEISIAIFIDSYWINAPTFEPIEVVKMLCEIISDNFEVKIDDNYRITISQNTIDISSELYDIITANGDSMNIDDIFVAFKEKYPGHKYSEASQLRSYLLRDKRICSIGKTSCYALSEWNIFTGTLKDLIYITLLDSENPLTAEELSEVIYETYETSPKSIRSTVVSDKSGKFALFKRGYIGVNTKKYSSIYERLKFANRRHRQSFEDSLNEYEEYLRTHHHMPLSTGTEDEQFLHRWYNNVVNRCVTITAEREAAFNAMVVRNADYMVNGTEYSFYRRCDEYKVFLDENMELPTMETDTVLYRWFHNNIKIYMEFDDRRKGYFEDLLEFIQSYGFIFT